MSEALKQFRAQYPMYDDMPDDVLAANIHKTFYADMSADDFNAKLFGSKESTLQDIGAAASTAPIKLAQVVVGIPAGVSDAVTWAANKAANGLGLAPPNYTGRDNPIVAGSRALSDGLGKLADAVGEELHTDEFNRKAKAEAARPDKGTIGGLWDAATSGDMDLLKKQANANWEDVKDAAAFYGNNPLHGFAAGVESAPMMLAPMAAAKMAGGAGLSATKAAIATGAAMEGASAASGTRMRIDDMSVDDLSLVSPEFNNLLMQGMAPETAKSELARLAGGEAFTISAIASGIASKLTGAGKFEADVGTGGVGGVFKGGLRGGATEFPQEFVESGAGQYAENQATKDFANSEQNLSQGVLKAATQGGIVGMGTGATVGAARGLFGSNPMPTEQPDNRPDVTGKDGTDLIGNQGNSPVIDTHLKRTQDELKAFEQQETEALNVGLAQAVQNAQAASVQNQQAAVQPPAPLVPKDPELQAMAAQGVPVVEITPPTQEQTQPKTKPEPVTPFDEVAEDVATPEQNGFKGLPIQELPVDKLTLSNDVPQFKDGANESGVVEPLGGKFDRTGVAPIQVWQRNDGRMEVISGRHRLDLARRSGESTIPVQVHREADGFDADRASTLDAELNIRDGQGKVADYVQYFTKSGIDKETAIDRGLLSRAIGKRSHAIATQGDSELIAAHRAGIATDLGAYTIATAFPNDGKRQQVALARLQQGDNVEKAVNVARALSAITGGNSNMDMFGFDDAAIKEAERMAKEAVAIQRRISEDIAAVQGAAKNPKAAAKFGVNVADPDGVKKRIESLKEERAQWDSWHTNPVLVAKLRGEEVQEVEPIAQAQPSTAQDDFLTSYDESTLQSQEANAKALAQQQAAQQNKEAIDAGVDNFSLDMGNVPDDDGGATFDMFSAPEPVAQPKPTQVPAAVETVTPTYDTIAGNQEIVPSKSGEPFKTIAAAKLSSTFKNTPNAEIKQVGDKQFVVVKPKQVQAVEVEQANPLQPAKNDDIDGLLAMASKGTYQPESKQAASESIVEHTTKAGKLLKGFIHKGTKEEAKEIDPYTFAKDGGFFIRAEHLPAYQEKYSNKAGKAEAITQKPVEQSKYPMLIGKNKRGGSIYENENGTRYYVDGGIKVDEERTLVPTRTASGAISYQTEFNAEARSTYDYLPVNEAEQAKPVQEVKAEKPKSTEQAEAEAMIAEGLDELMSLLGGKMNMTPEQESQIIPIMAKLFRGFAKLGYIKFKDAAAKVYETIESKLGKEIADQISIDNLQAGYINIASEIGGNKKDALSVDSIDELRASTTSNSDKPAVSLVDYLYENIKTINNNRALKAAVAQVRGIAASEVDQAMMKDAQETMELALVRASRDVIAKGNGIEQTYNELVELYKNQPALNIRSSTSMENQAYSTPAPIAYLSSMLAGIDANTTVYEPTAGNGMLLIAANPGKVYANELEDKRVSQLKDQGFAVNQGDATKYKTPEQVDAAIMNPPFGSMDNYVLVDGFKIKKIDHLITAKALESMKANGRATIIIGANKDAGVIGATDRVFFNWLYSHYNVVDHFEIDGSIYERQGAGWPIRVIAIHGRNSTNTLSPKDGTIERVTTWEEVYGRFNESLDAANNSINEREFTDGDAVQVSKPSAAEQMGLANSNDGETTKAGRGRSGKQRDAVGDRRSVGTGGDVNIPSDNTKDANRSDNGKRNDVLPVGKNTNGAQTTEQNGSTGSGSNVGGIDAGGTGVANNQRSVPVSASSYQADYITHSKGSNDAVLTPVNMASATDAALSRIENEVGNLDDYVMNKLGYESLDDVYNAFMGLQVDTIAASIYNAEKGKATIIADQTGVGKGRQAAGVIRYALRQGKVPVFITVKDNLFSDMFEELESIGEHNARPFIMNNDAYISKKGQKLFRTKSAQRKANLQHMISTGSLPDGANMLFLTYSQVNTENDQRRALEALGDNVFFVMDESHNAAGEREKKVKGGTKLTTAGFLYNLIDNKPIVYLSATYAKRPDNIPIYYRTSLTDAVDSIDDLVDAVANGGAQLQTIMAGMLAEAGQLFRRERSFEGIEIKTVIDTTSTDTQVMFADTVTDGLRAITDADRLFHTVFLKYAKENAEAFGATASGAGNKASASVDHTNFTSIVHNFISQLLLGMKAKRAVELAIEAHKRGEKPVIALENTMGTFLSGYVKDYGMKVGDVFDADYRDVLNVALERTRRLSIKDANGNSKAYQVPLSSLDPVTRAAYDKAANVINALSIEMLPVSPIDYVRAELTKAGIKIAEITGRDYTLDYTDGTPILSKRSSEEVNDRNGVIDKFNDGRLDALVLNVAGATGLSIHASTKFKDQKPRHMIVMQAMADINILMQMLGRINRTGQVVLPTYTMMGLNIPAEKRPLAKTANKMKSLNANTSANTDSDTSVDAPDILNKYGDKVVEAYLSENPHIAEAVDIDVSASEDADGVASSGLALKFTGRMALLPVKTQVEIYAEIEQAYNDLIDYLNKVGQNDLVSSVIDLDAKILESKVIYEGKKGGSIFGADTVLHKVDAKYQGKPPTARDVTAELEKIGDGKAIAESIKASKKSDQKALEQLYIRKKEIEREIESTYVLGQPPKADDESFSKYEEAVKKQMSNQQAANQYATSVNDTERMLDIYAIGSMHRMMIGDDLVVGVVVGLKDGHKGTGNPYSLSKTKAQFMVNNGIRNIELPFSRLQAMTNSTRITGKASAREIEQYFGNTEIDTNKREYRYIATGNLIAGSSKLEKGRIVSFTDSNGKVHQGILMPASFGKNAEYDSAGKEAPFRIKGADTIARFLRFNRSEIAKVGGITSPTGITVIRPNNRMNGWEVKVPKSNTEPEAKRIKFDKELTAITGDLYSKGTEMTAEFSDDKLESVVRVIEKSVGLQALSSMRDQWVKAGGDKQAEAEKSFDVKFSEGKTAGDKLTKQSATDIISQDANGKRLLSRGKVKVLGSIEDAPAHVLEQAKRSEVTSDTIIVDGVERSTRNSNGQLIHPTKRGIENFWRWFGDSKVVDSDGKPLVVYHGTKRDFNEFKLNAAPKTDDGWFGDGFYTTAVQSLADNYAMRDPSWELTDEPANTMPLYVKAEYPYTIDAATSGGMSYEEGSNFTKSFGGKKGFKQYLDSNGYDSVVLQRDEDMVGAGANFYEVVSFEPNAIKSAIGNNGDFDPENKNILHSQDGNVQGFFDPATDTTYLVADALTADTIEGVLVHEVGVHAWWRNADKATREALGNRAAKLIEHGSKFGNDRLKAFYNGVQSRLVKANVVGNNEEAFAYLAEEAINEAKAGRYALSDSRFIDAIAKVSTQLANLMSDAIAYLKSSMHRLGWLDTDKLTGADLVAIAKRNMRDVSTDKPTDPNGRGKGVKFSIQQNQNQLTDQIDEIQKAVDDQRSKVLNRLKVSGVDHAGWMLAIPNLKQLADIAKHKLPQIQEYTEITDRMAGHRNKLMTESGDIANDVRKWVGKNRAAANRLFDLMHEATISGIDPSEPYKAMDLSLLKQKQAHLDIMQGLSDDHAAEIDALEKQIQYELSGERRADYDALAKKWVLIPNGGRRVFQLMRDHYKLRALQTQKELLARIARSGLDDEMKKTSMGALRLQFESTMSSGVYFPLARFGEYWLSGKNPKGEREFRMYDSESDRKTAERKMIDLGYTDVASGVKLDANALEAGANGAFVSDAISKLDEALGEDAKQLKDDIYQFYLQSLPDMSMRKAFIHRKKTKGYSADALRAFAQKTFHMAHQLSKLRHSDQLTDKLDSIRKEAAKGDVMKGRFYNEMVKRHNWVLNPTDSETAAKLTGLGFLWYLGASPAAAAVNATQLVVTTLPVLSADHGSKAFSELGKGMKDAVSDKNLAADELAMMTLFTEEGVIETTMAHDLAGMADTETGKYNEKWAQAMSVVSWMFHKAEVFNRRATALAAYRLAKSSNHADPIGYARQKIWETQFDYSNSNRARWMQANWVKVVTLFKQYALNMSYFIVKNTKEAITGTDLIGQALSTQERKVAKRKIIGLTIATLAMGGLAATPFYFAIVALAGMAGDDDDDSRDTLHDMLVEWFGEDWARFILKGGVNAASGIDISSRMATDLLGMWYRTNDEAKDEAEWTQQFFIQQLGPVVGIAINAAEGVTKIGKGEIERGAEQMVPKMIKDLMQAARFANEGALTIGGDKDYAGTVLVDEFNAWQLFMKANGFTPEELSNRYDANGRFIRKDKAIKDRRAGILTEYWTAFRNDDKEAMSAIIKKDVMEFNTKYPQFAIDGDTLSSSIKTRIKRMQGMENGVYVSPKMKAYMEQNNN